MIKLRIIDVSVRSLFGSGLFFLDCFVGLLAMTTNTIKKASPLMTCGEVDLSPKKPLTPGEAVELNKKASPY